MSTSKPHTGYKSLLHFVNKLDLSVVFFISELFLTRCCTTISSKRTSEHSVSKNNPFFDQTFVPIHSNSNYSITPNHSILKERQKKKFVVNSEEPFKVSIYVWPWGGILTNRSILINPEILISINTCIYKTRKLLGRIASKFGRWLETFFFSFSKCECLAWFCHSTRRRRDHLG